MTAAINYPFTTPANYTFDANKIEVSGGAARLKLVNNPSQDFEQDFSVDTGFTYDAAKSEFSGGKLQQIDHKPTGSTSWATYTSNVNLNYGGGILTGTPIGGASIVGNRLDLAHDDARYVDYNANGNCDSQQTGAIRFKLTPNYSVAPVSNQALIVINKGSGFNENAVILVHKTTGQFGAIINDSVAGSIFNTDVGAWVPTSGITYEIEFNFDLTAGASRLFIDGVQLGATQTGTGTRDSNIGLLRIGNSVNLTLQSNFYLEDFIYFSAVQHTSNYTPGYTLAEARYVEDLVTLPNFVYPGGGSLQAYTDFATTQTGSIRFNINGEYWNGAAWVASDDSYAQMNSPADVLANLGTLAAADTVSIKLRTTDNNTQEDIDTLTLEYTGQIYPVDTPTIEPIETFNAEGFVSFTNAITEPGGDEVKFTRKVESVEYYWTGSAWAVSSGFAQSNTTIEMNTSGAFVGGTVSIVVYLSSNDGSTTPEIDDLLIVYDIFAPPDALPQSCIITGYILDANRQLLTDGTLTAIPKATDFIINKNWLTYLNPIEVSIDTEGRFEIELIRSAEFRNIVKYDFTITPTDTSIQEIKYLGVQVPNSSTANFNELI